MQYKMLHRLVRAHGEARIKPQAKARRAQRLSYSIVISQHHTEVNQVHAAMCCHRSYVQSSPSGDNKNNYKDNSEAHRSNRCLRVPLQN